GGGFGGYGGGGVAGVDDVERAAKVFAADAAQARRNGLSDDLKGAASARAKAEDTVAAPVSTETAAAAATGSGLAAGFAEQIGSASTQLAPFADAGHVVKYVLLALALAGGALAPYAAWQRAKVREAIG